MKRHIFHYYISEVAPYIDWGYLLHAWGLTGKEHTGEEIIADAKAILHNHGDKYQTHAIFALCEAKGANDDIIADGVTIPCLRQQHAIEGKPNLCLSDFISPHGDNIGFFATTIDNDFGTEYKNDPYMHLLTQTLADRLAEATASLIHMQARTRKEIWGYAQNEDLSIEELLLEKNQGIRPAVGYPSLPDQSIIFTLDNFLHLNEIGIALTPNGAMTPHASVCGMMISHPQAHYFGIGKITEEQLNDYAERRGTTTAELIKFLSKNIE
jgi:cobalamin-dependent methionine synthase I